jgi:basic membrane protein A
MKLAALALATALTVGLSLGGATAAPKRPLKVGYVVGAGAVPNKNDLFGLPYAAFIRAVKTYGIEGRVLQVAPNQDAAGPLGRFARERYDLIIMGSSQPDSLVEAAHSYPNQKFLSLDWPVQYLPPGAPNIRGSDFRAEQAGYLAGYLAALMEKRRPGRHVISSVGGMRFWGVDRWIIGYRAGAKRADPGVVTLNAYSNDFSNPALCKSIALGQIAKGAGVVFNVAGHCGLGALEAAKEKGVWGVGVDVDQSFLGSFVLTSAVLRLDRPVLTAIRGLSQGRRLRTGTNTVFDLRNGGVGLGRISPDVPPSILRKLERLRRGIVSGRIKVPRAV